MLYLDMSDFRCQRHCLTNTQLMCILDGSLLPEEARYAEEHLDECASCRGVLIDLVKVLPDAVNSDISREDLN